MKGNIKAVSIFLCASGISAWLVMNFPFPTAYQFSQLALFQSAVAFLLACGLVCIRERLAYWLGLASGVLALYGFHRLEFGYLFPALNSWIVFNLPDGPEFTQDIFMAKLKILFFVTIVTAASLSVTRLLPETWLLGQRPIRDRTWPAIAICFAATLAWYAISVSPYRIPLLVDHAWPQLVILHVEKSGVQFHETSVSIFKDGRVFLSRNDRRMFQYRFELQGGSTILAQDSAPRISALAVSRELGQVHTAYPAPLRSWKAEGWYVLLNRESALAFSSEDRKQPPSGVVALFRALESTVPINTPPGTAKDVCLGFCYDPMAGLGMEFSNDRCRDRNGTHCI